MSEHRASQHGRLSGAERERRRRRRLAEGRIVLHIEVDEVALAETMIELHHLSRADAGDRARLGQAVERLLASILETP